MNNISFYGISFRFFIKGIAVISTFDIKFLTTFNLDKHFKILFLARWYPDRYDPMPGLFIQRHAAVASAFAHVTVLYLRADPECKPNINIENKFEFGCNTIRVYYGTKLKFNGFPASLVKFLLFLNAFVKGYSYCKANFGKPNLLHVNVLTRMGVLAYALKIVSNIPYVITEHWSRYLPVTGTYKGFFRKLATKIVVQNADALSTVSHNLAAAMQAHGLMNQKFVLLPNVVDYNKYTLGFKPTDRKLKRILHVSCFEDKSKNISGIIHMLSQLVLIRNDFHVYFVGEGIDFNDLKQLADNLQLTEVLTFKGLLENEELIIQYQQADFLLMFSNYENMPVVISEAFACGLPVLATSVGGIPEFVNSTNGVLVAPGDGEALLEKCVFMLNNIDIFDRQTIRSDSAAFFSNEAVEEALMKLYDIDNS